MLKLIWTNMNKYFRSIVHILSSCLLMLTNEPYCKVLPKKNWLEEQRNEAMPRAAKTVTEI